MKVLLDQGQTGPEVERLYRRALSIFESVHGTGHSINASTILQNLGILYFNRGKLQAAEVYLKASIGMKEELQGPQHPDLPHVKANLAFIYGFQGRVTEAIALYEEALDILVRYEGKGWVGDGSIPGSICVYCIYAHTCIYVRTVCVYARTHVY
jgi:tetratricopeptide (TPR) repeat protein